MKNKKVKHFCNMAEGRKGKKSGARTGKRSTGGKVDNKVLEEIFDRYYKNQVAALYRAIGK